MSPSPVLAAGAVCWRVSDAGRLEFLAVHRPVHRDVSLPKGKVDPGETLPETAVREIAEETGLLIRLGTPLGVVEYELGGGKPKHVYYWAAEVDPHPTTMLDMPDEECFHFASRDGLLHPLVDLGDPVAPGQPIAQIWPPDRSGLAPEQVLANRGGILAARHFPGLVQAGDCLAVIAVVTDDPGG